MKKYTIGCLGALVVIGFFSACGPSQRRTYQSDNAFSRCFDRDYDPEVILVQKKNCWSDWLMSHQYNQPDDKAAYARLRLAEISDGVSIPGPPGPAGNFDERPSLPTQSESPIGDAGPPQAAGEPEQPTPRSADCETRCRDHFQSCSGKCLSDAGADNPCKNSCDTGYRSCMKSCF